MSKNLRVVSLKVTEFSKEGHGQGNWLDQNGHSHSVEVPFTIPGDEVQACLFKKRGGIYQSRVIEWEKLSDQRIPARCQHFGSCGGCRWQQIQYEDQIKLKEAWLKKQFEPYLHSDVIVHPIIPCSDPWEYRNKMELTFSNDRSGNKYLGLILHGTRGHVFQMQECHLMSGWIIDAVKAVTIWWEECGLKAYYSGNDEGALRNLTLREGKYTGDRMVMLTVSGHPSYALNQKQLNLFVHHLRQAIEVDSSEQKLSIFLRIQQIAKGQKTQFYEMQLYGPDYIRETLHIEDSQRKQHILNFRISPTAFFQPNPRQAEQLYSRALQLTPVSSQALVYDLYCGTGTFGICMASQVQEVIGIELSPESALDARENIKLNQLDNMSVYTGDVGKLLPTLLQNKRKPDVVIVDPPRAGLDSTALKHLIDIKAPQLTYISCNPKSQVANLEVLIKAGYRLKAIQPVDQFPQTVHLENIAILTL